MSVLTILVELISITPTLEKISSAERLMIIMFALSEYWTFSDASGESAE